MNPKHNSSVDAPRGSDILPDSVEMRMFRMEMQRRDLNSTRLARTLGLKPGTIANRMAEGNIPESQRPRIEALFGMPIWSSRAEFERRAEVAKVLGFDPREKDLPGLMKVFRSWGVPLPLYQLRRRKDLIEALFNFRRGKEGN